MLADAKRIDVLSDSTGETAEKVVRAAMLQFPHSGAQLRLHTRVRTKEAARPILERAAREGALVVFTVVSPELREYIHAASYELRVEALDLIGSLIGKLTVYLDRQPINTPSGMLPLSDEYFRRIEAVEFTVKSDDGKEPRNFKKADLVLVGVSRTSKTPLSTLLAGVTPDEAHAHPIAGAHSIWELVRHMSAWTQEAAQRLRGGVPALPVIGDFPPAPAAADTGRWASQWGAALAELIASHEDFLATLDALDPAALDAPAIPTRDPSHGTGVKHRVLVHGLAQHHAYHGGQIALLRKAFAAGASSRG